MCPSEINPKLDAVPGEPEAGDTDDQIEELRSRVAALEIGVAENIKLINQYADVINGKLSTSDSQSVATDFLEKSLKFLEQTYTHGQTYTTVVVGGRYAALFTLWNHLREVVAGPWPTAIQRLSQLRTLLDARDWLRPEQRHLAAA